MVVIGINRFSRCTEQPSVSDVTTTYDAADLAPTDLRGGYLGAASSPWSIGAVLGPLVGSLLLDHAGRPALVNANPR